jgi:hypothetical protein
MKFWKLTLLTTVAFLGALPIPVRLAAQNTSSGIINFDVPGAGRTQNRGRFLTASARRGLSRDTTLIRTM